MADFQNADPAPKPPDHDPYLVPNRPDYRLHSPDHVALATFLGSPVAGGLLMAFNYRRLGNTFAAWGWAAFGVVFTGVQFVIADLVPPVRLFVLGIAAVGVIAMYCLAKHTLGAALGEHKRQHGQMASGWAAAGTGLACIPVVLAVAFAGAFVFPTSDLGEQITFGDNDIHYTEGATEQEARALLGVLRGTFGMTEETGMSVQLRRHGDAYVVAFVLQDDAWNDPDILAEFRDVAFEASADIFDNRPVIVELRDDVWELKRTIKFALVKFGDADIYYTDGATEQEARALCGVLTGTLGITRETSISIQLRRDGDAHVVALVLQDDAWDDPEILAEVRDFATAASVGIFDDRPVVVELCDEAWKLKRTIKRDGSANK